ncbi:MAG TPA: UPF0175 family protein [Chloroflexota bacterium]|jgi:hypothetical protein|nr:UPF0175 family protein [Chloroflexota bacterium]
MPDNPPTPPTERRAPRNRLTRWAAMAAAAGRYREGRIPVEQAAKEAGVTVDEFQQFLIDSPART